MPPSANRVPLVIILALAGMGLLGTAIGAAIGWSSWRTSSEAQRTQGRVVELARVEGPRTPGPKGQPVSNNPGLAPVVEYQVGGQTYRIQGQVSSSSPAYAVGESVDVLYQPDRPAEGRIDSFAEKWLAALVFGGGGLLFTLIGFGMLWSRVCPARGEPG
jgi:hypothetical protein